jgi:hypothetical protein
MTEKCAFLLANATFLSRLENNKKVLEQQTKRTNRHIFKLETMMPQPFTKSEIRTRPVSSKF